MLAARHFIRANNYPFIGYPLTTDRVLARSYLTTNMAANFDYIHQLKLFLERQGELTRVTIDKWAENGEED